MAASGVELEQVAAVHADLEAGFSLEKALAIEGIEEGAWPHVEAAWKVPLVDDPEVFARYRQTRAEHRRRLARSVKPLDEDLDAWVVFLRCYEEADDPHDLLDGLRLTHADVALLGEHWDRRYDQSTKLVQRAGKVALRLETRAERHGEKAPVPRIEVGVSRLVASPAAIRAARHGERRERIAAAEKKAVPLTLDAYAALIAALEVARPEARGEVLAKVGLDAEQAEALDEVWQAKMQEDRLLRSDFQVLRRHYVVAAKMRQQSAAAGRPIPEASVAAWVPPTRVAAAPVVSIDATSTVMPALVIEHVLPFVAGPAMAPAPVSSLPPVSASDVDGTGFLDADLLAADVLPFPIPGGDGQDLDGTAELVPELLAASVTPFVIDDDAAPPPRLASLLRNEPPPPAEDLDATRTLVPMLVPEEPLPFERGEPDRGVSRASVDDRFDMSLDDEGVMDDGVEPFVPPSAAEAPPPVDVDTTGTFTSIDWSEDDIEALPASDGDLDATSAFVSIDWSEEGDLDSTSAFRGLDAAGAEVPALPFAATAEPPAPPPRPTTQPTAPPRLTLSQYASLHLELERWPQRRAEILTRYQLDEAVLAAEDGHWRAHWTPTIAQAFQQAQNAYRRWLDGQRR